MTQLSQAWLHSNSFTGPIPDLSKLGSLTDLSLRDNQLMSPIPATLTGITSLKVMNLTNNLFQGPFPVFNRSVGVDIAGSNSFCGNGSCDPRIVVLLSISQLLDYPAIFAENWKGNDPCGNWLGILWNGTGYITSFVYDGRNLTGTISPTFSKLSGLQKLTSPNNSLTSTIPVELTTLLELREVDLSNNQLTGKVPAFRGNVVVNTIGNPGIKR